MKIIVLASGRGSGFQSMIDHVKFGVLKNVEISYLVTNNPQTQAVERAKKHGIRYEIAEGKTEEIERKIQGIIKANNVDLIVLAGWMKILSEEFVRSFPHRITNIHPSLLPKFGGKGMYGSRVHEAVLEAHEKTSGCTVHFVTENVDGGPIIIQHTVPVLSDDTPESLAARVLVEEHKAYPKAIQLIADQRVKVSSGKAIIDISGDWDKKWKSRQLKYVQRQL